MRNLDHMTKAELLNEIQVSERRVAALEAERIEFKKNEQALRASEDKFSKAFHTSPDSININRLNDGMYLEFNDGFTKLTGYTREDVIGKTSSEIDIWANPEDRARLVEELRSHGEAANFEATFKLKNGEERVGLMSARIVEIDGQQCILSITRDITERKNVGARLRESEERFRLLAENSPTSIMLHRDESIFYANPAATKLLGASDSKELIGRNILDFVHPDFRSMVMKRGETLREHYLMAPLVEEKYLRLDGTTVDVEVSAVPFLSQGEQAVQVIINDITERKQNQEIIRLRLSLLEFAVTHSLDELLQKTLDEIEGLTDSSISFFHFVEADQKTLSLQAWSTRTQNEFCEAQGKGLHYPVDEAGVWADCVRERQPVIHNDYQSLPHRKGLPDGHAQVIRELAVPITRGEYIVAILGVGNKQQDYTEKDIELVSYLADVAWEIAERKQAEEALKEKTEELDRFFSVTLDLLCIADADGYFRRLNPQWEAVLGYARSELEGQRFLDLVHPDDRVSTLAAFGELDAQKTVLNFVNRYRCKDGSYRWIEWRSYPMENLIYAAARDITERKRAEEALRDSEERFRKVFEEGPLGMAVLSPDDRFIRANEALCRMLGYQEKELVGLTFVDITHPEDIDVGKQQSYNLLSGASLYLQTEKRYVAKDGQTLWVNLTASIIHNDEGIALYKLTMIENITQRKKVENALRTSEERLQQIISVSHIGIFDHDYVDDNVYFSPAYREMRQLGQTEQVTFPMIVETVHPEDRERFEQAVLRAHDPASDGYYNIEYRLLRRDGTIRWLIARSQTFFAGEGSERHPIRTVGAVLDVTESRQTEEALRLTRFTVDSVADAVYWIDPQAQIVDVNEAACRMLGYTREELIGMPLTEIDIGFSLATWPDTWKNIKETGKLTLEARHRTKAGRHVPVEVMANYIEFGGRELDCAVVRDISERKKADEVLQMFKYSNDQASIAIFWMDRDAKYFYVNNEACRSLGYTRDELLNLCLWDIDPIYPKERWYSNLEEYQVNRQGGSEHVETFHRRKDGIVFPVEVFSRHLWLGENEFHVAFVQDITERKQAATQLERSLRETQTRFEISQALAGAETEDDVLDMLIQHAGIYLQAFVTIFIFDREGDELIAILQRQNPFESDLTPVMSIGDSLPASRYTLFNHFMADHPFVSEDVWVDERFEAAGREILRQTGVASYVAIPLTAGNEWMGYIAAMAKSPGYFDEEKQHLYQTLAEQGAVALRAARLRETIRESQQRLSLLVQQSPLAVIEWDTEFQVVSWNPAAEQVFGYTSDEALGCHANLIVPEQARAHVDQVWQKVLTQKGGLHSTNENLTKDGRSITCEWFNAPLVSAGGQTIGVASLVRDITEHKKAEQALRESEERLRQIASSLREVIWLRDAQTRQVLYVNPAFEELTGRTCESFYENQDIVIDAIHPDDRDGVINALNQRSEGVPYDKEHRIIRLDSSVRWVSSRSFPVRNEAGELYRWASIMEDITEHKRAEEEIRRLNEELEQRVVERTAQLEASNKELEAFSYSVSHDLRAPLRAIDGFSRILIEDHASQLPDEMARLLRIVRNNTQQMGRLIDDLLSFSRLSRQPINNRTVNTADLVRQVLETLQNDLEGRDVEIEIGELPDCLGDLFLLKQVWLNLIDNAIKYTGRQKHAKIKIGCLEMEGESVYYVRDNGVGFDMQYADKLFGVFQRLHRSDEFEGTGVGLAIVQRIIHRHGGRVWTEAELNVGATFYFTI